MNQPIKLQLNAEALVALFPEGSQARIDLQQAVVAEFVRKHLKERALGTDVFETIDRARRDAAASVERARTDVMTRVLAEQGLKKEWSSFQLTGEAKTKVEEAARGVVTSAAYKAATEAATAAVDAIKADVDGAVQRRLANITDAEVRGAVKKHLDAVMANLGKTVWQTAIPQQQPQ